MYTRCHAKRVNRIDITISSMSKISYTGNIKFIRASASPKYTAPAWTVEGNVPPSGRNRANCINIASTMVVSPLIAACPVPLMTFVSPPFVNVSIAPPSAFSNPGIPENINVSTFWNSCVIWR